MASEHVTEWLQERKPTATVRYHGPDDDGIHRWELVFPGDAPSFHLGVPEEVLENEGVLAERLMELNNQGWMDQAGEEEHLVYLYPMEIAREPSIWE